MGERSICEFVQSTHWDLQTLPLDCWCIIFLWSAFQKVWVVLVLPTILSSFGNIFTMRSSTPDLIWRKIFERTNKSAFMYFKQLFSILHSFITYFLWFKCCNNRTNSFYSKENVLSSAWKVRMEVRLLTWWILKKDSSRETCICTIELTIILSSRCYHNIFNSNMIPFVGICLPPCMLSLMSKRGYFPSIFAIPSPFPPLASKLVGSGKKKGKNKHKTHTKKLKNSHECWLVSTFWT